MSEIKIHLPDGSSATHESGIAVRDILTNWKKASLKSAVAAKVNGVKVDLSFRVEKDADLEPIEIGSREGLDILRHSISHVMAQAVQEAFPGVRVSIGPSIEDGFYYDFDYSETFTLEDLQKIEKKCGTSWPPISPLSAGKFPERKPSSCSGRRESLTRLNF